MALRVGMRCWAAVYMVFGVFHAHGDWTSQLDHGKVWGFPTYDQAQALLNDWLQQYPQLIRREQIGKSYEGRAMYVYIVGAGTDRLFENQPQVMITSLMHAREPASLTVLLYFLGHLLEQHETGDPDAVYVIQTRRLYMVPFVNPDGWVANEGLPNKVIRKNRRPTCDGKGATMSSQTGVDLNRNFAYHWAEDFDPCNEEYQGTKPFSEPETQALKKLIEEHKFRAAVNFHSYGGMLTHPFNFGKKALPDDDQHIYDEIAKVFKWPRFGPAIQTVGYTANGESDDWMYATHGIISMSPEVGPENGDFWPPATLVDGIDKRNYVRTLYIVKKAGLELGTSWTHSPSSSLSASILPGDLQQRFKNAGGLPASALQLRLDNMGISTSAGEALNVAISGATRANVDAAANAFAVLEGDGPQASQKPARLIHDSGSALSAPILAFQVPPLSRRSSTVLQVLLAASLEANWPMRYLTLCVAEMPRSADPLPPGAPAVCQCIGPHEMPAPTSPSTTTSKSSAAALMVRFAGRGASTELQKLCSAAVAAAQPAIEGSAAASSPASATAPAPTKAPSPTTLDEMHSGDIQQTAAPSNADVSSGNGLVIFSIAGIASVMAMCLVAQVVFRQRRNTERSTPRQSSIDGQRVPAFQKVPDDLDDGDALEERRHEV